MATVAAVATRSPTYSPTLSVYRNAEARERLTGTGRAFATRMTSGSAIGSASGTTTDGGPAAPDAKTSATLM